MRNLQLWNSTPLFVPRILNVAKAKDKLIVPSATPDRLAPVPNAAGSKQTAGRGAEILEETASGVSRWVVWSSDMHIGPISDLKQVAAPPHRLFSPLSSYEAPRSGRGGGAAGMLETYCHSAQPLPDGPLQRTRDEQIWRGGGIETHDESLSAHCHRTGTCASSLQVLTPENAMTLGDGSDLCYLPCRPPPLPRSPPYPLAERPQLVALGFLFRGARHVSRARHRILLSEKPGRQRRCLLCLSFANTILITPARAALS